MVASCLLTLSAAMAATLVFIGLFASLHRFESWALQSKKRNGEQARLLSWRIVCIAWAVVSTIFALLGAAGLVAAFVQHDGATMFAVRVTLGVYLTLVSSIALVAAMRQLRTTQEPV